MKTSKSLVNVRDPKFIRLLLPRQGEYEGLRTLVAKWESLPSGTFMNSLYNASILHYKKIAILLEAVTVYVGVTLIGIFGLFSITQGYVFDTADTTKKFMESDVFFWYKVALCFFGVGTVLLFVYLLVVRKSFVTIKSKSLDELQEVIEVIYEYSPDMPKTLRHISFELLSKYLQEHIRYLVECVINLEIDYMKNDLDGQSLEKLHRARREMRRFSKICTPLIGHSKSELGQYFDDIKIKRVL